MLCLLGTISDSNGIKQAAEIFPSLVVISSACRLVLILVRYWWNWCNVEGVLGAHLVVHGLLGLFVALGFALGAYLGRGCT
jgi:hypothetical protein